MARFDKESLEYKTLYSRCQYTMKAQQDEIDAGKGIQSDGMPKEWFDYSTNKINVEDSDEIKARKILNLSILANKKPYYFIYNYPRLNKEVREYVKNSNRQSRIRFGIDINQLNAQKELTDDQKMFLEFYNKRNPIDDSPSVMNKLCNIIEDEFSNYKQKTFKDLKFDYSVLKSDVKCSKKKYTKLTSEIKELYVKYTEDTQTFMKNYKSGVRSDNKKSASDERKLFTQNFFNACKIIESDMELLTNVILDICYTSNKNKQFVWDMCGEQIIKNLLVKHDNKILFLQKESNGKINYNGNKFTAKYMEYEVLDESDIEREDGSGEDFEGENI